MAEHPVHWPALLPDETASAWAGLRAWVELLMERFALSARVVAPCWYRHNPTVEALSALRDYEKACYGAEAALSGGVDFLRALRDVEYLLGEWTARSGCTAGDHHNDPARASVTDDVGWDWHVTADLGRRTAIAAELDEGVLDYQ